ncbi:SCO3374 family protein [Streptomyces sp. NPDC093546]|uniref:SCO3374 family protein n=1 Tax=Streptomyces sp. NPDC093546 TaxID=3366040 RepID=UPI003820217D
MAFTVPLPRLPLDDSGDGDHARWYAHELGWAAERGPEGVELLTGLRFDALELPAAAGAVVLRRLGGRWPVAVEGRRMRMLVAAGSAEEVPGLLQWLEWGGIALDLTVLGAGGRMPAPVPPGLPPGRSGSGAPGASMWLRPPLPGREVEPTLPALPSLAAGPAAGTAPGDRGNAPCLVRLVDTAATACHRVRLLGAGDGAALSGWRPRTPS